MSSRRAGFLVSFAVVLAGCSFQASCGGKKFSSKKVEAELARQLETFGGSPAKVTCPEAKLEKGLVIECTTDVQGAKGRVKVTQIDDQGTVSFEDVAGYVYGAKAEQFIVEELKKQTGVDGKVDCGERVRSAVTGAKFPCTATAPNGDKLALEVTMTDALGAIRFETVSEAPPAPPAPPAP